jgi:hypothetical protein
MKSKSLFLSYKVKVFNLYGAYIWVQILFLKFSAELLYFQKNSKFYFKTLCEYFLCQYFLQNLSFFIFYLLQI